MPGPARHGEAPVPPVTHVREAMSVATATTNTAGGNHRPRSTVTTAPVVRRPAPTVPEWLWARSSVGW